MPGLPGPDVVTHHDPTNPPRPTRRRRPVTALAAVLLLTAVTLTACASDDSSDTAAPSASPSACPTAERSLPGGGSGMPTDMPSGAPGAQSLGQATTIEETDNSTSTVIDPQGAAITCDTSAITTTENITYASPSTDGTPTDLKLDIQVPQSTGDKPLVVYITGGGWQMSDRTGNLDQRTYIAGQGYVVASIQYRTVADGATYRDALTDVKSAIRYLRAHAGTYGIDPDNVFVWGQSAGGYLAAMAGVTNGDTTYDVGGDLDRSSAVQGVVDEFGPANLSEIAADYDQAAKDSNHTPGNAAAQWVYGPGTTESTEDYTDEVAAADPATHISSSTAPFLLMHGTADPLVSPSQTLTLFNALKDKGVDAERVVLTGAGHGDLSFTEAISDASPTTDAAKPWSTEETMGHIQDFLDQHTVS
ncbi:prolyl oligopeptidase family serine peptidase [Streptomyces sp. NPDC059477]|uniref:prolyl oligopeptidase family serine peptidase n=1 Tax=Streptomyces sp. NPDC059477 TaxID=3346847 RepID=UPI0036A94AEA